jgi:hypothetical protein
VGETNERRWEKSVRWKFQGEAGKR